MEARYLESISLCIQAAAVQSVANTACGCRSCCVCPMAYTSEGSSPSPTCWEGAVVLCCPKAHVLNKEASPRLMNTGHSGAELKVAQDFRKRDQPGVWSTILSKCLPKNCLLGCSTGNTCPAFPRDSNIVSVGFRGLN